MIINLKKTTIILFEISLFFLLLQQTLFPSELTLVTLLFSILSGGLMILTNKKIMINPFLVSYCLFLILVTIYVFCGYSVSDGINRLFLYFMGFVSTVCLYNYLIINNNIERFMKLFIIVAIISLIFMILLIGPQNIIGTRFGHNGSGAIVSYYIFNNPIYKSSNGTANVCAIAMLFSAYFLVFKKEKKCLLFSLFFFICSLLCGSRKGVVTVMLFITYIFFFMKKGFSIKKILFIIVLPTLLGIMLFKIPFFYNSVGFRIESFFGNFSGNNINTLDGNSYLKRQQLKNIAYEWIERKPIYGYGVGVFVENVKYGAENNILQLLLDYGLIGLLIYYSFIISFFKQMFNRDKNSVVCSIFVIIILSILMQDYGSVTYSWQHTTMWYSIFWAVMNLEKNKKINNYRKEV